MFRLTRYVLPAVAFSGLTVATLALAQPPEGAPKGGPKERFEKKGFGKKDGPREGRSPRHDAAVESWARTLIEKINDPHDTIRDSARAGLVAIGRPALPLLRPLAEGEDGALATAASKVMDRIEAGERPPMRVAFGPGPDGPPRPPMPPTEDGPPKGEGRPPMGEGRPPMGEGRPPMGEGRPPMGEGRRPFPPFGGPEGRPGLPGGRPMGLENAIGKLKLDDGQREKVKTIIEEQQKRMRETFEKIRDGSLKREDVPEAMRENHEQFLKDLREVLNEEQMSQFRELLPQGPPGFGGRPGNPEGRPGFRPGNPPEGRPGNPPGEGRPGRGRPPMPPKD